MTGEKMSILRNIVKYVGILLGSILLGMLLMILAYSLPVSPMKANAQRSTEIFDYEGVYPQLMWGYKMSQLDNCTDATMILNATYAGTESVVEKAVYVFRTEYDGKNPVKSLTDYANNVRGETYDATYSRYWHGYLTLLKPLLLFFDLADIRIMNMFFQVGLLCYILLLMERKQYGKYIPAFVAAVLLLNPVAIALSLQFSTCYYLVLFSVIFVLKKDTLPENQEMLFFFLSGILTAFFDFLTYPLAALLFPLTFILIREESWKQAVKKTVMFSVLWGIGYVGMWCGKWTIGSILVGRNLWVEALNRAAMYKAMKSGEDEISNLQVIFKNVRVLVKWPVLLGGVGLCTYYVRKIMQTKSERAKLKKQSSLLIAFGIVALAPFVWYLAAGTHSYEHYWFTYRELCISVFAILAGVTRVFLVERHSKNGNAI